MTDTPSCPAWCARPDGHSVTSLCDGSTRRWHVSLPIPVQRTGADADGPLELEQFEVIAADGARRSDPVGVRSNRGVWQLDALLAELDREVGA